MPSLICSGVARTAMLVVFVFAPPIGDNSTLASEHRHSSAPHAHSPKETSGPRIATASESYEFTGSVERGTLSIRLKRKPDGSPVTGARIKLTIDGESGEAREVGNGSYTYRSATLSKDGEREVIITIKDGEKNDLLIGKLASEDDHKEPGGHAGHSRDKHDGEKAEGVVNLTPDVLREFGVTTEAARPGVIANAITRPAEISFNMDRFTHVVPRVRGIAKWIRARQGDNVKTGQLLAVLESRELAELKGTYLAALERFELAKDNFARIKTLRKKGVTTEKSFLTSRTAFAEARIAMRSAKQKLRSIGVGDRVITAISKEPDSILTQYALQAPMRGMIVKRHLVQGELVKSDREAFTIADMSSVWINISLYSSDLPKVRAGQVATLETENGHTTKGTIAFVSPNVSEQTRTATARVVLTGHSLNFRPGMFIKASIGIAKEEVALRIPLSALHSNDGKDVVFVNESGKFKLQTVKIGRRNGKYAEVIAGLKAGDVVAAKGAFLIKSQLSKANFDDGHNH